MSFVEIKITSNVFETAIARAADLPSYRLNFKQYLQENGGEIQAKLEGTIGEVAVEEWLKSNQISFNDDRENPTHDYSLDGNTLEVKTKVRTVAPKPSYECSLPEYTMNIQTANLYVFVSLTQIEKNDLGYDKYPHAYIVGVISKKRFIEKARHFKKGDKDPLNNYIFKKSCYNVYIKDMTCPSDFPAIYKDLINNGKKLRN